MIAHRNPPWRPADRSARYVLVQNVPDSIISRRPEQFYYRSIYEPQMNRPGDLHLRQEDPLYVVVAVDRSAHLAGRSILVAQRPALRGTT
jgi:hypothetical protein